MRIACYLCLAIIASTAFWLSTPVLAQEEAINLEAPYPKVESTADRAIFRFPVSLRYQGDKARQFNLSASGPLDWDTYVTSSDESIRISVIRFEPNKATPDQVKVIATPPPSLTPAAGDYRITLVASSADLRASITLTAVVIPRYSLELTQGPDFHQKATAGQDNNFSLTVKNDGSGELTNVWFSADEPQGWLILFKPEQIDRLAPGISHQIQIKIKPAFITNERYQNITITAEADQVKQTMPLTIYLERAKWFWRSIGGGIALVVIGAFTFIFLRFGRSKQTE